MGNKGVGEEVVQGNANAQRSRGYEDEAMKTRRP
jgi:hypothetical protein